MDRFQTFFLSCDSQFGFKKGTGCRNPIYTVRNIVDKCIKGGDTVNVCAIDLTKAYDKVNHNSLYMKLMNRDIPLQLLELLENWLSDSLACVKWGSSWSHIFNITLGVRQAVPSYPMGPAGPGPGPPSLRGPPNSRCVNFFHLLK